MARVICWVLSTVRIRRRSALSVLMVCYAGFPRSAPDRPGNRDTEPSLLLPLLRGFRVHESLFVFRESFVQLGFDLVGEFFVFLDPVSDLRIFFLQELV